MTAGEESYLSILKNSVVKGRAQVKLSNDTVHGFYDILLKAKGLGCSRVATTSPVLLKHLLAAGTSAKPTKKVDSEGKLPSVNDYAGSIIERGGLDFLILPPMQQLVTVPYGKFIYERYWNKYLSPTDWLQLPDFRWELFVPSRYEALLRLFNRATFIAIDIETIRNDPERRISCCGFTAVTIDAVSKSFSVVTVVVPFTDMYFVAAVRAFAGTAAPKVLQNGKYDIANLLRYGICLTNFAFDTIQLFHAWYSELPKDLAFIVGFVLRKWEYWKDESSTGDLMQYYGYNAKDCFTTAMSLLALLMEMPPWAIENFKMKFACNFPCIQAESTGIKADIVAMARLNNQMEVAMKARLERLRKMVGNPHFNPNSSQQTLRLFVALGSGDIKSSSKIPRDKVMARHPLNKKILSEIASYREDSKLFGTYLDKDKIWHGRIYYAINPHGTDTGRNSSSESQFWSGLQIQNIPRDRKDIQIKEFFVSDPGFYLGEADGEQAEARDTAYLSGDLRLIAAVEGDRDYHGVNAERFFGIPYEKIVGPDGEVLDKIIRDLSKRTNHGSNYNMGAGVLLDTMGIENVLKARKVLRLSDGRTLEAAGIGLLATCQWLLNKYAEAYPTVKGAWYNKCRSDVTGTRMLVGPTGWTRYCFGNPKENKRDLNRYVAHPPQSLNAMVLDRAWIAVFREVARRNPDDFKLLAQIHDSILFSYRIGYQHLAFQVKQLMEIVVPVKDAGGITRDLLVPVALKGEATRWTDLKKMTAPISAIHAEKLSASAI